jgi:hypothetical protein
LPSSREKQRRLARLAFAAFAAFAACNTVRNRRGDER